MIEENKKSGEHAVFISSWMKEYKDTFGESYLFQGAKDGAAASRLVKFAEKQGHQVSELITLARKAWFKPHGFWSKQAVTIAGFASRFNEIRAEVGDLQPSTREGSW